MLRTIYADFNATTPLVSSAIHRMQRAFEIWGNPSSSHQLGRSAAEFLEESRRLVAEKVGVPADRLVFTSGGSEANGLALLGFWLKEPSVRVITSGAEHSSVVDCVNLLANKGANICKARLRDSGELDLDQFEALLKENRPHLVSLMVANNETGVLFPMEEIVRLCRQHSALLHTDAVQSFGKLPLDFRVFDYVSISAHKIGGPKGIGALIVNTQTQEQLIPTHYGGSQEIKRRGGTQNTVGIAGFAGACSELATVDELAELRRLRDDFETSIGVLDGVSITGHSASRLPNTTNVRFHGIPAEVLLGALDLDGICLSAGSACSSGSIKPSHVLLEMGLSAEQARECLRISWGKTTTSEETNTVATALIHHVNRIRHRRGSQ